MQDILSPAGHRLLARLARTKVLLAFDFDGTLAPIVRLPESARLRPSSLPLLTTITNRYPTAVITGRSRRDVIARLEGIAFHAVVGNHGIEDTDSVHGDAELVRGWRQALLRQIGRLRGVQIEDKHFSLAIHYRQASDWSAARASVLEAARRLPSARIITGKGLVNIIPLGAPDKGVAIELLRERFECEHAIYVGDDETDEDVFARAEGGGILGIRVRERRGSKATHFLRSQPAIDLLLARLAELRNS